MCRLLPKENTNVPYPSPKSNLSESNPGKNISFSDDVLSDSDGLFSRTNFLILVADPTLVEQVVVIDTDPSSFNKPKPSSSSHRKNPKSNNNHQTRFKEDKEKRQRENLDCGQ